MLAAVRTGTLDLTIVASGLMGTYAPEIGLLDMPFLFRDAEHGRVVLDGPVGEEYAKLAQRAGIPVLSWAENGVRHLTANRPIQRAADLKGLKLRVMPAPILREAFVAMGADASGLSFNLLYEALRVGTFDAQENPLNVTVDSRLYEVQSHLMLTAHTYSAAGIVASADLLEDLSATDRQALALSARAGVIASRQFVINSASSNLALLRNHGMTVLTDIDRASFQAAAESAMAAAAGRFGADRISRLRSA